MNPHLFRQNQANSALGSSMVVNRKKFRYMSPPRFLTLRLMPKNMSAFTNLQRHEAIYYKKHVVQWFLEGGRGGGTQFAHWELMHLLNLGVKRLIRPS